jgi:aspartate beta-hydroxylase
MTVFSGAADVSLAQAAEHAMRVGDLRSAATLLGHVAAADPTDVASRMKLAACRRGLGEIEQALDAVNGALSIEPRFFLALLMKAALLERAGRLNEAGPAYGAAILQAPPDHQIDEPTRGALAHGRSVNARYTAGLHDALRASLDTLDSDDARDERKINAFIDFLLGRRKRYQQEPMGYFYPGLPAIEFWDRSTFPWLETLEAETPAIQAELAAVMRADSEDLEPYVNYDSTTPLDQWADLNRSRRWSAYHLLAFGKRVEDHCVRCPRTMAALAVTPQPVVPDRSPAAMFSVLEARTHIPPHTGVSNTRLVVHLPLVIPEGTRFRVGGETRSYRDGEAWVFDDTIEHEAWNDSGKTRIILLFDVWNPLLNPWEQAAIAAVSGALDAFNGTPSAAGSPL